MTAGPYRHLVTPQRITVVIIRPVLITQLSGVVRGAPAPEPRGGELCEIPTQTSYQGTQRWL